MERNRAEMASGPSIEPTYAPLVLACEKFGIGKTKAFDLAKRGELDTFKIGARTYVMLDSLKSLPLRMAGDRKATNG